MWNPFKKNKRILIDLKENKKDDLIEDLEYISIAEERLSLLKWIEIDKNESKEIYTILAVLEKIKKKHLRALEDINSLIKEYRESTNQYKNEYCKHLELKQKNILLNIKSFEKSIEKIKQQFNTIILNNKQ